jgi:hypothetical protein
MEVLVLTSLPIGERPRTAQKPRTNAHFVDDRNDVATSKLIKWQSEFPPTLGVRRDKLHETACPAKEKDDA